MKMQLTAHCSGPRMNRSCRRCAQFPDESCVRGFPAGGSDGSQQCGFFVSHSPAHSHPGILGSPCPAPSWASQVQGPLLAASGRGRGLCVPRWSGRRCSGSLLVVPGPARGTSDLPLTSLPLQPNVSPSQILTKASYCKTSRNPYLLSGGGGRVRKQENGEQVSHLKYFMLKYESDFFPVFPPFLKQGEV